MADTVLLSGVSGFLGKHIALGLLAAGYHVRGSVRAMSKAEQVRAALSRAGADIDRLSFVQLDLSNSAGWDAAAEGSRFIVHTASPVVLTKVKNPQTVIGPAVAGVRHAISAGLAAGAERIVLTSSTAAIQYGHTDPTARLTEANWTDPRSKRTTTYAASKTLAEREAWRLADEAGRRSVLSVIHPGVLLGPLLDSHAPTSAAVVAMLLDGKTPAVPKLSLAMVDVRDVVALHVDALTNPAAAGQRCIAAVETLSLIELSRRLRPLFPDRKLPRATLPDWLVRTVGRFSPEVASVVHELGWPQNVDGNTGASRLGRPLIDASTAAEAMGRSLISFDLL